ncbi:hypothetical protein [Microbacterium sp.]|uniref:hypothetical protein n=1 Tax=Microbacterium sp. TaxID=51671 RepID=UPI003C784C85
MRAGQLSAARAIWGARRAPTGGGAYALYAFVLAAVFFVVPVVHALWVVITTPDGIATLTSVDAPGILSFGVAVLWSGGLLVGRKRGPALLPPFLLYALTGSEIRRSVALRRPLLRSAAVIVTVLVASATLVGTVLISHGQTRILDAAAFVVAVGAAGIVATLSWLTGQVFPRASLPLGLAIIVVAGLSLSSPQLSTFVPWGWVGATYPTSGSPGFPLVSLVILAASFSAATPLLLNSLTGVQLSIQAADWERATAFSLSFDFRAASAVYGGEPRWGRGIRAVRPGRYRWATFLVRDLIGQVRMPVHALAAITASATAGVAITISFLPGMPSALLAGAAGVLAYAAGGPLTRGLRHAANVAGDYPLYGISDRHLVALHTLFPLATLIVILSLAAASAALASDTTLGIALAGAWAIGILTLALRLSDALKGPLPPSLLAPLSTPAGDLSVVMRIGWAVSEAVVAILGAVAAGMLPDSPVPLILVSALVGLQVLVRWRKRR